MLATLQAVLVIGVLVLAGFVAMVLLRYVDRLRTTQRSLDECTSRFECLHRDSHDAILLLDEHNFYDCNEATLRIFQLETYKELRRKHPADLSPPLQPDGSDSMTLANQHIAAAHREARSVLPGFTAEQMARIFLPKCCSAECRWKDARCCRPSSAM